MNGIVIEGATRHFGLVAALDGVSLQVAAGEFVALVGPSGCGKTTLMRIVAGIETADAGRIVINDRDVTRLRAAERNVAMVFQSYALYPHMSVGENIAMPLVMDRLRLSERLPLVGLLSPRRRGIMRGIQADVAAVSAQLEIDHLLARKPAQLSGGQRQRVALGRAMVRRPAVFLMDEPLSNLDSRLRMHMRAELAELHRRLGATFIYVTHDQTEAMTMSDRVAMMDEGRIVQLGTPDQLYHDPSDLRVARFIGAPAINVLPAVTDRAGTTVLGAHMPIAAADYTGAVQLGIRPEAVTVTPPHTGQIAARLRHVENLGAEFLLHVECGDTAHRLVARLTAEAYQSLRQDRGLEANLGLRFTAGNILLFNPAGQRLGLLQTRHPALQAAG